MKRQTFDELYEKYHQDLYKYLLYIVRNRENAEELVQEVYIKVFKYYDTFKGESNEKTWLFSIAKHIAIDHYRKHSKWRNKVLEFFDWSSGGNIKDSNHLPEDVAFQKEQIQLMYRALDKCTIDQKKIIVLRYIQELSIKETAEILNVTEAKVRITQHRGIKNLQKHMGKEKKEITYIEKVI